MTSADNLIFKTFWQLKFFLIVAKYFKSNQNLQI